MGYIYHSAVITGFPSLADARLGGKYAEERVKAEAVLAAFKGQLPEEWQALIVGPVEAITNGYAWIAFLPDGSKEGWEYSKTGARYRFEFLQLFGGLTVRWGDDDPIATWVQEVDDE